MVGCKLRRTEGNKNMQSFFKTENPFNRIFFEKSNFRKILGLRNTLYIFV